MRKERVFPFIVVCVGVVWFFVSCAPISNPTNPNSPTITPTPAAVTTLAGSGTAGFLNDTGTNAAFSFPVGLTVDGSGNVFVADQNNNRIRKITAAGVVSTFAGSGTGGFADGTGVAASFYAPYGICIDNSGNLYVGDGANHRVRKVTSGGVASVLAGSGTAGFANGTGTAASFFYPSGTTVDSSGNVYIADEWNHRIRKVTSAGVTTTLAGSGSAAYANGTGTAASFNYPKGVAVDSSGNVFVADNMNNRIRKITSGGVTTSFAGSGTGAFADGTGAAASFYHPEGIAVDGSGNVYVADTANHRIRKITSAGVVTTIAGTGTAGYLDGTPLSAQFSFPRAIAIDSSGVIYITDDGNRVRKLTL